MLRAHGVSDKGRIRPVNEDCWLVDQRLGLCVVADGMGGHNAGDVAASMAVGALVEYLSDATGTSDYRLDDADAWPFGFDRSLSPGGNLLRTAVHVAHMQVLETALTTDGCSGMGTTIVAALVRDATLSVAHVGDSRLYLYAGERLRQLTDDDSWVAAALAEDPRVDPARFLNHPLRHALTNAIGAPTGARVHVVEHTLRGGELLTMTTDGVHGVLGDRRIGRVLSEGSDPTAMAANLVRAALASGSQDNCTAVVARYSAGC